MGELGASVPKYVYRWWWTALLLRGRCSIGTNNDKNVQQKSLNEWNLCAFSVNRSQSALLFFFGRVAHSVNFNLPNSIRILRARREVRHHMLMMLLYFPFAAVSTDCSIFNRFFFLLHDRSTMMLIEFDNADKRFPFSSFFVRSPKISLPSITWLSHWSKNWFISGVSTFLHAILAGQ